MEAALNGSSASASAGVDAAPLTCTIGGQEVTLQRLSARKSSRALAQLRALSRKTKKVQSAIAEFTIQYERENFIEYDPVQARLAFPPQVLADATGRPILEADKLPNGEPNPRAGELLIGPSPIDSIPPEAWEATGGYYRRSKSPSWPEVMFAVLDVALEEAEMDVYALLALFLIPDDQVKEVWRSGGWNAELEKRAEELLDTAFGDEILVLAVACSELVDDQFVRKARDLGSRLGNLGRLAGIDPASLTGTPKTTTSETSDQPDEPSSDGLSNSTPTSSTSSDEATDGQPTSPSTSPSSLSRNSSDESDETTNSNASDRLEEAIPT